jgi:hypothetical protein
MKPLSENPAVNNYPPAYSSRTPDYFVEQIDAAIRDSFTPAQLTAVREAIESAMPRPAPKIVDLRVNIDLIVSRFYIVLFVGKERRKNPRTHQSLGVNVLTNRLAAIILLVGLNLTVSLFIFLMAYLIKSSLGVNLFTHHLSEYLG